MERPVQIELLLTVDEEPHMRAHAVLLVNHPKSKTGEPAVKIVQNLGQRRAFGLDHVPMVRV
ncbi:hypothetical protein NITGR_520006 [Nitrospina gracilis 3/211]|uniref:Uncharacterized protein n=1 Tax=Nitrospina gracilis (strain 3/211) TaxID=1266370 RepID=M1ZCB4_NITG3|nr:hypothetical protein NITGR_520006 [Nitrospina gracilis 3/211]